MFTVSVELALTVSAALIGWSLYLTWGMKKLLGTHDTHLDAIEASNKAIDNNSRCMRELSHYVSFAYKRDTGETPPPFVDLPQ